LRAPVPVIFLAILIAQASLAQTPQVEYQIKATFLFNFAKYVEWPNQAFPHPDSPFMICLAGDPFEGAVEQTVAGERLDGRPFIVKHIVLGDNVRECHMLYIAASEARRSGEMIGAVRNLPILTVGEPEDFINTGGMIRFTENAHRIRFQINPDAAERASLKVSSRLLRLADIVRPRRASGQ
jgi:hypothetical protein